MYQIHIHKQFSADLVTANVSHCNAQGMLFYLHRKDLITQNTKLLYSFDFLHQTNCQWAEKQTNSTWN